MSRSSGSCDVLLDGVVVDSNHSYELTGNTRLRTLTVLRGGVLNMNGHCMLIDEWAHVEGRIVSVGCISWALIRLSCWLKRRLSS